jgi:hypothetical protein
MIGSNARSIRSIISVNALIGGSVRIIKTATIHPRLKPRQWMRDLLSVGDEYQLVCGHQGKVIWISADEQSFAVQGKHRSCINCGKKTSGSWAPTVYTFQAN